MAKTKSYYTFPNHDRIKMERMGKHVSYMDHNVYLGSKNNMPPGSRCVRSEPLNRETPFKLRPAQEKVFNDSRDYSHCLIEAYTGFGKTALSFALLDYWGGKTLIIVHTKDMVTQFMEEFDKFFGDGWAKKNVGQYFSNKKSIKDITITTTRSFSNAFDKFVEYGFDNIIRDEADTEFSERQRECLCDFPAKRVFGLTGTIKKEEFDTYLSQVPGDEPALVRFYGHYVKADGGCDDVLKDIFYFEYEKKYEDQWGLEYKPQSDWIEYRKQLDGDKDRKMKMMRLIHKNIEKGEHVMVLFDRVEDTELFWKAFRHNRPDISSYMVHGSVNKNQRASNIENFKKGGGLLFGQYKTVGRGFNNVKLSKIFIMFPIREENSLVQMIGRVLRKYVDKESVVYDWVDSSLKFQYQKRKKVYKQIYNKIPKPIELQ